MASRMLLLLCYVQAATGAVTDKDLKKKLGVNPAALKKVTWKDLVNKNMQVPWGMPGTSGPGGGWRRPSVQEVTWMNWVRKNNRASWATLPPPKHCEPGIIGGGYRSCCNKTADCQKPGTVRGTVICDDRGLCDCNRKQFYFPNINDTACEYRRKRELGQSCTQLDYCHVAFATCSRRKCVCKDGFFQWRGLCYPKSYDCPYGLPLVSKGQLPTCNPGSSSSCPDGYFCLEIPNQDYPVFRTLPFGGYCCPNVPDVTTAEIDASLMEQRFYGDVCFFGKPYSINDTNGQCPEGHYHSQGIGIGATCCPEPCLILPATVNNGKCTY